MRWKNKSMYRIGDIRIKTKFLFFPKQIGNIIRWMEKATWQEEFDQWGVSDWGWKATKWID